MTVGWQVDMGGNAYEVLGQVEFLSSTPSNRSAQAWNMDVKIEMKMSELSINLILEGT